MIVLASASPRRQEILKKVGFKFDIITVDIDESINSDIPPELVALELAAKKAAVAAGKCSRDSIIIGADTIVCIDDIILGKPTDENDAFNMLKRLSGRVHEVLTGVAVIRNSDGFMSAFCESTKVEFHSLSDKDIKKYIKTGEPMDKAGSYGIQGEGGKLIKNFFGDFNNVVGLPIKRLKKCLENEFGI